MRVILFGDKCEYTGCTEPADILVYNRRDGKVMKCCSKHTDEVVEYDHPEYGHICENCECLQGVN